MNVTPIRHLEMRETAEWCASCLGPERPPLSVLRRIATTKALSVDCRQFRASRSPISRISRAEVRKSESGFPVLTSLGGERAGIMHRCRDVRCCGIGGVLSDEFL